MTEKDTCYHSLVSTCTCTNACVTAHMCTHTWTHIYIYTSVESRQSLRVPLSTKQNWVDILCTICHHTSTDRSPCHHRVRMVHLWKFKHLIDTSLSHKSPYSHADHNCPMSCSGVRVRIWFYPYSITQRILSPTYAPVSRATSDYSFFYTVPVGSIQLIAFHVSVFHLVEYL